MTSTTGGKAAEGRGGSGRGRGSNKDGLKRNDQTRWESGATNFFKTESSGWKPTHLTPVNIRIFPTDICFYHLMLLCEQLLIRTSIMKIRMLDGLVSTHPTGSDLTFGNRVEVAYSGGPLHSKSWLVALTANIRLTVTNILANSM